jgi:exodeoxyribonuclease V alpha subunit
MSASSLVPIGHQHQLTGLIERVTFFSEESGFCVLRVKAEGQHDLVTVVGSAPSVSAGEWIVAEGHWVIDKDCPPGRTESSFPCDPLRASTRLV